MTDLLIQQPQRALTSAEFQQLSAVPAEVEWFANIDSEKNRRAYQNDLRDFSRFIGIDQPEEFRTVTRAHVIAWPKTLEERHFSDATVRRKLAALSALFEYLCEKNAVTHNPVKGVKRLEMSNNETIIFRVRLFYKFS